VIFVHRERSPLKDLRDGGQRLDAETPHRLERPVVADGLYCAKERGIQT